MKEEKQYYEKVFLSTGEVPEYYKPVTVYLSISKDPLLAWLASDGDNYIWTVFGTDNIVNPECWLKEVSLPSPKQEAVEFADRVIKRCNKLLGTELYRLDEMYYPDDCIANYTLSELYDKFKEKGEK